MEFSLNGAELSLNALNSVNSENLINHWSINWDQFNCPLLAVSLWNSGRISVSHTGDGGFEYGNCFKIMLFLSLNSAISVKTFRENSNQCHDVIEPTWCYPQLMNSLKKYKKFCLKQKCKVLYVLYEDIILTLKVTPPCESPLYSIACFRHTYTVNYPWHITSSAQM